MQKYQEEKSKIIRESIGEAILSLLLCKEFSEISVSEICKKAGVGRTTYYRYYGNKNGKDDAIYYWLINRWEDKVNIHELSLPQKDIIFLEFIFSIKEQLILMNHHRLLSILDSFILHVYGPTSDEKDDLGIYYFKYTSSGLWIGMIRAIINRNFTDSQTDIQQMIANILAKTWK